MSLPESAGKSKDLLVCPVPGYTVGVIGYVRVVECYRALYWRGEKTMAIHTVEHVQERDDDYFVGATRVTLGSAIAAWQQGGERPESVTEAFSAVSLADAYGAVAFYLDHRQELDQFFAEQSREFERLRAESQAANPEFYADLRRRMDAQRASRELWPDES